MSDGGQERSERGGWQISGGGEIEFPQVKTDGARQLLNDLIRVIESFEGSLESLGIDEMTIDDDWLFALVGDRGEEYLSEEEGVVLARGYGVYVGGPSRGKYLTNAEVEQEFRNKGWDLGEPVAVIRNRALDKLVERWLFSQDRYAMGEVKGDEKFEATASRSEEKRGGGDTRRKAKEMVWVQTIKLPGFLPDYFEEWLGQEFSSEGKRRLFRLRDDEDDERYMAISSLVELLMMEEDKGLVYLRDVRRQMGIKVVRGTRIEEVREMYYGGNTLFSSVKAVIPLLERCYWDGVLQLVPPEVRQVLPVGYWRLIEDMLRTPRTEGAGERVFFAQFRELGVPASDISGPLIEDWIDAAIVKPVSEGALHPIETEVIEWKYLQQGGGYIEDQVEVAAKLLSPDEYPITPKKVAELQQQALEKLFIEAAVRALPRRGVRLIKMLKGYGGKDGEIYYRRSDLMEAVRPRRISSYPTRNAELTNVLGILGISAGTREILVSEEGRHNAQDLRLIEVVRLLGELGRRGTLAGYGFG